MLTANFKEYLGLRSYAISIYSFSDVEEYGSYFLMIIGWLSFVSLDLSGLIEFFIAIPLCILLGLILREIRLTRVLPAIVLAWILDADINEKFKVIDNAINDINDIKSS